MKARQTISMKQMGHDRVRLLVVGDEQSLPMRPKTRGECADVPRPCPFVSCRHHLLLEVNEGTGALKFNHLGVDPSELPANRSCSLDVADEGGITLEEAGNALNLTRERARQIELKAFLSARESAIRGRSTLGEFVEEVDPTRPPVTSGHAANFSDPVVDPFAEFEARIEPIESRTVSMLEGDDESACTFVWEMFAKRYGLRSRASLIASRARAARDVNFDSDGQKFYGEKR